MSLYSLFCFRFCQISHFSETCKSTFSFVIVQYAFKEHHHIECKESSFANSDISASFSFSETCKKAPLQIQRFMFTLASFGLLD